MLILIPTKQLIFFIFSSPKELEVQVHLRVPNSGTELDLAKHGLTDDSTPMAVDYAGGNVFSDNL
jgi:hypothetical protein